MTLNGSMKEAINVKNQKNTKNIMLILLCLVTHSNRQMKDIKN